MDILNFLFLYGEGLGPFEFDVILCGLCLRVERQRRRKMCYKTQCVQQSPVTVYPSSVVKE